MERRMDVWGFFWIVFLVPEYSDMECLSCELRCLLVIR